jgi:hypothetical protein
MNAIIFYENATNAIQAKTLFERAAHRADFALQWLIKPWRLDMLSAPLAADMAMRDALDAHLILFGLLNPRCFPSFLSAWLENWAARRRVQNAALAVWDFGNGDVLSGVVAPELSRFAENYGLSFILGNPGQSEVSRFARPRLDSTPNRWARPLTAPIPYYRHGINE